MRQFNRYMLNALAAVSIVLCLVSAVLWTRSYKHLDWASYGGEEHAGYAVVSVQGALSLWEFELQCSDETWKEWRGCRLTPPEARSIRTVARQCNTDTFDFARPRLRDVTLTLHTRGNVTAAVLWVRHWLATAIFGGLSAVLLAIKFSRRRSAKRPSGYDLGARDGSAERGTAATESP